VTGSTANSALGLDTLKRQKEHFDNVVDGKRKREPDAEKKRRMEFGTQHEIDAIVTVVSKVIPFFYPRLSYFEEGCEVISSPNDFEEGCEVISSPNDFEEGCDVISSPNDFEKGCEVISSPNDFEEGCEVISSSNDFEEGCEVISSPNDFEGGCEVISSPNDFDGGCEVISSHNDFEETRNCVKTFEVGSYFYIYQHRLSRCTCTFSLENMKNQWFASIALF
jgi:hypothetical protein